MGWPTGHLWFASYVAHKKKGRTVLTLTDKASTVDLSKEALYLEGCKHRTISRRTTSLHPDMDRIYQMFHYG